MEKKTVRRVVLAVVLLALAAGGTFAWLHWDSVVVWHRVWRDFEYAGRNEQGYAEYRHRLTGLLFVRFPGGSFDMGSPEDERQREGDEFLHKARVGPFLIAKYEVTQQVWKDVMGRLPSPPTDPEHPVVSVTWNECQEFCRRTALRFPSEAEWEYACRAGTQTPYVFGQTISTSQANFGGSLPGSDGTQVGGPVRVYAYEPNPAGLHNMTGNVWEWCEDKFDYSFYTSPAASKPDPVATKGTPFTRFNIEYRVTRGGGWSGQDWRCRSANRDRADPEFRSPDHGFRPAFPLGSRYMSNRDDAR